MPTAVKLSLIMGVGGCRWPISSKATCMGFAWQAFQKSAPSSASAADDATSFNIVHNECTAPFRRICLPSTILLPKKKWPPA
eukprot:14937868-Ditylum_brightwellii.AAC.1